MSDGPRRDKRQTRKRAGVPVSLGRAVVSVALLLGWLLLGPAAEAQRSAPVRAGEAAGLLGAEEGLAIVDVALEQVAPVEDGSDCSHVVHAIYASAGHAYPYAPSADIYSGNENFVRVRHPRAGDVIAWWGHLGIVMDPAQHSFYSLVRTGLKEQNYESAYWRSRGQARFYRLRVRASAPTSEGRRPSASARPILSEDR
jgi:hypothetical protein